MYRNYNKTDLIKSHIRYTKHPIDSSKCMIICTQNNCVNIIYLKMYNLHIYNWLYILI